MNQDLLISNICKHVELNASEKERILGLFIKHNTRKNDYLVLQGELCQNIYFITSGTLRAFCLNQKGKESTVMFGIKDWWITDMYCFLNKLPAMVSIQAVEESSVLKLSKADLDALLNEIPAFNSFFRILMQNAYCREQLRMIQNLSIPALDRYQNFLQNYPMIAQQVPLKHIASYLGVTPEFLSTARSRKN